MLTLADFQQQTAQALNDPVSSSPCTVNEQDSAGLSRRFNIYRNNRAASLIDALQSTYPVLYRLTGETFFRAAARQYIDETPPAGPVLSEYGKTFGEFLQALPGTADYPYLKDVAALEWQWLQSYHAADDSALTLDQLGQRKPSQLLSCSLVKHDAARLFEFKWAIGQLWSSVSAGTDKEFQLDQPEAVLVSRPELDVRLQILDTAGTRFLKSLLCGFNIAEAANEALDSDPEFDTGTHLQALIASGVFTAISSQHDIH